MAEAIALATMYRRLLGARIRSQLQYRLSFWLYLGAQCLASFADLLTILIIFDRIPLLEGWSIEEMLFLYGTSQVAFALTDTLTSPIDRASLYIRQGTFDQLLVRPLGALFQLATLEFELRRAGKLIQAVAALGVAIAVLPVPWTPARAGITVMMIVSGFVIFSGIWVITTALSFWTVETTEVANSFTYGGGLLSQYPMDVFGDWLRGVVLVVPLAFVSYLPAAEVLRRSDAYGFPSWVQLSSPVAAFGVVLVARAAWGAGVRHYRSTGS